MNGRPTRRALLACVVVLAGSAATPVAAAPRTAKASFGDAVVRAVNAERRKVGVRPLRRSRPLAWVAAVHANEIGLLGRLDHASADGTAMPDRIRAAVPAEQVGETLAWLPPDASGAALAVGAWMRSPTHRASLLSPAFARIGVARRPAMAGVFVAADLASAR